MPNECAMRIVSSLEKCFWDEKITQKPERDHYLMYRNEKLSFQLALCNQALDGTPEFCFCVSGALADYVTVREVISMPAHSGLGGEDDGCLRTAPGLYPDMLRPMHYRGGIPLPKGQLRALWVDVQIPEGVDVPAEETALTFSFVAKNFSYSYPWELDMGEISAYVRVSPLKLPAQTLIHTEWLYSDCIAEAHGAEAFSEKHWEMLEKYVKTAVDNGINMILTPLFTPELDTYIGGERLTTQLVKITVTGKDTYAFDYTLLDRWIDMCERLGVTYYEIPHFFTQWGAEHAPKFIATVDGEETRIFGWETDALGEEYRVFLAQLITSFVAHAKSRGIDKRCYYHISDEPRLEHLEHYKACKNQVAPYLEGYAIIDALSDFDFYKTGALDIPVPAIKRCHDFLRADIAEPWVYYCGAPINLTGRCFSHPTARTRILGVQLYRHRIKGFLHWGYNFYRNRHSYDHVDVLGCTDAEYWTSPGNAFLVYPGTDGTVWESIRLNAMREAMDDMRALALCESVLGRERTEELISVGTLEPLTFFAYPKSSDYLLSLHDRVLLAVEQAQI